MMRGRYVTGTSGRRPNEIRDMMRIDHDIRITYWKAWFSRELAMDTSKGSVVKSYQLLPSYLQQLVMANPGSIVELQTEYHEGVGQRFKYLFCAMGESIK